MKIGQKLREFSELMSAWQLEISKKKKIKQTYQLQAGKGNPL